MYGKPPELVGLGRWRRLVMGGDYISSIRLTPRPGADVERNKMKDGVSDRGVG